jgi:hypothetical protein
MFIIFKNDSIVNFWGNSQNDIFIQNTCKSIRLNENEVDLIWYNNVYDVPKFYEFDQDKKLIIKKEIVTINEVVTQNENGEDIVTQEEVKSYEVDKIIDPIFYFSKGLMIKPC